MPNYHGPPLWVITFRASWTPCNASVSQYSRTTTPIVFNYLFKRYSCIIFFKYLLKPNHTIIALNGKIENSLHFIEENTQTVRHCFITQKISNFCQSHQVTLMAILNDINNGAILSDELYCRRNGSSISSVFLALSLLLDPMATADR